MTAPVFDVLREHLRFAVPLRIEELRKLGLSEGQMAARQANAAKRVAHRGDSLLFDSKGEGRHRNKHLIALEGLVDATALACLRESAGVEVFGDHYCAGPHCDVSPATPRPSLRGEVDAVLAALWRDLVVDGAVVPEVPPQRCARSSPSVVHLPDISVFEEAS